MKPENLLLDDEGVLKICDFGCSEMVGGNENLSSIKGTPAFMAPELLLGITTMSELSPFACDMYSVGACLFMFVSGRPPYWERNELDMVERLRRGLPPSFPRDVIANPNLTHLLRGLLHKESRQRFDLRSTVLHDWTTKENSQPVYKTVSLMVAALADKSVVSLAELNEDDVATALSMATISYHVVAKTTNWLRRARNRILLRGGTLEGDEEEGEEGDEEGGDQSGENKASSVYVVKAEGKEKKGRNKMKLNLLNNDDDRMKERLNGKRRRRGNCWWRTIGCCYGCVGGGVGGGSGGDGGRGSVSEQAGASSSYIAPPSPPGSPPGSPSPQLTKMWRKKKNDQVVEKREEETKHSGESGGESGGGERGEDAQFFSDGSMTSDSDDDDDDGVILVGDSALATIYVGDGVEAKYKALPSSIDHSRVSTFLGLKRCDKEMHGKKILFFEFNYFPILLIYPFLTYSFDT